MNDIEIKNVSKRFGKIQAVNDVSFDVESGECFALLGPNGAGKSTLIRIITTLSKANAGTVSVLGHDSVKSPKKIRRSIGLVSEKTILYDRLTALENLLFFAGLYHVPRKIALERAERFLRLVDMWHWKDKVIENFSTGMKQKVNVVRAFIHEPKIAFLDEPTLALDPQTSLVIRNLIKQVNKSGTTIVLTTHLMHEVERLADRIAIMNSGRIVAFGSQGDLKKSFLTEQKEITLELEEFKEEYASYFGAIEDIGDITVRENTMKIVYSKGETVERILSLISEMHLPVREIITSGPSLEDIFLELTNHKKG